MKVYPPSTTSVLSHRRMSRASDQKPPKYQLVCASQAVKQTLIQKGMAIKEAPVVYPGAHE